MWECKICGFHWFYKQFVIMGFKELVSSEPIYYDLITAQ